VKATTQGWESDGGESGFLTDCSVELGSPFHEGLAHADVSCHIVIKGEE